MKRLAIATLAAFTLAGVAEAAPARLAKRMDAATEVIEQLVRIPEQGIPPQLLDQAYGVAVIPGVIKAGLVIGGRYGKGVLVVRQPDGSWSNPAFISLAGGSIGWQGGAQASDLVLVFKSRKGVDDIAAGKLTLGADAAVAAGPVGRYTTAATDLKLKSEIYSYSRSRGLFAGISIDGAVLRMDEAANRIYYRDGGRTSAAEILGDATIPTPANARRFIETLASATPRLDWRGQSRSAAAPAVEPAPADDAGDVRTFGIDDGLVPADDTLF